MGGRVRKRNRWNMEKKNCGGIGKRREDRIEWRGRGRKLNCTLFNVQYCTEGAPRYMSGKGRRVGVRNKEGSMGSGERRGQG